MKNSTDIYQLETSVALVRHPVADQRSILHCSSEIGSAPCLRNMAVELKYTREFPAFKHYFLRTIART